MRIAWSSGEKNVIAEGTQCYYLKRRGNGLSLDESRILLSAGGLLSADGLWRGFADRA